MNECKQEVMRDGPKVPLRKKALGDGWPATEAFVTNVPTSRREARAVEGKQAFEARCEQERVNHHNNLQAQTGLALDAVIPSLTGGISVLAAQINRWMTHQGFWTSRNVGEKLALMHSEISEAMEADRKQAPSDKIFGFSGVEEEIADLVIRALDFCHENDLRLVAAIDAKMKYNLSRPHMHGKKY